VAAPQPGFRPGASQTLEHPACVLPWLHLQAQAAARTPPRMLSGVSAIAAAANSRAEKMTRTLRRRENPQCHERAMLIRGFLCRRQKKPMVRAAKNSLLLQ